LSYTLLAIPEIRYGEGSFAGLADAAQGLGSLRTLVVMDGFLAVRGLSHALSAQLIERGIETVVYDGFTGEPKISHLRAAADAGKGADLVIGIGGGSALDIAKITACTVASAVDPMHYALAANPLPRDPLRKIMVPTTAGTGSETSATNIFTGPDGKKLWIWGTETKADLVILDPQLTASLPANLTAWCGLDAFIHAFEASTNRNTHPGAQFYAHEALRRIAGSLETAVKEPENMAARGNVLLGSCLAGIAIDNCGTAIAHNVSHALAGLAPVHHGLATALGFEATLEWLCEADTPGLNATARACGLSGASELPLFFTDLMTRCGMKRALPAAFGRFSAADLARAHLASENQPMRRATIRDVSDDDIDQFAATMMALPGE
jgi:alcohol dehydrogenase class IV